MSCRQLKQPHRTTPPEETKTMPAAPSFNARRIAHRRLGVLVPVHRGLVAGVQAGLPGLVRVGHHIPIVHLIVNVPLLRRRERRTRVHSEECPPVSKERAGGRALRLLRADFGRRRTDARSETGMWTKGRN